MKLSPIISLAALALAVPAIAAEPQNGTGETDGYRLVWQDLFDGGQLNPMRWDIEVNGNGGGNNELQYYTDNEANVRVGDDGLGNGCLILTARRESHLGKSFTSGRVNSKNRIAFTHGKIEASIKFPSTADGLWPAFWMMGNDFDEVGWPKCGETDIIEMGHQDGIKNQCQDKYFNGACHWGQSWPNASYAKHTTKNYSLQDGEFHLFTVIWDQQGIKMYVDLDKIPRQNPYYSMDCPCDDPDNEWSPGNYFHKDNFILFNLAVGGNFPGIHDPAAITALNDANGHAASMYVNYVKIYQKGDQSEHADFLDPGDKIESGVQMAEAEPTLRFDGSEVTSTNQEIDVFTPAGVKVASSACGRVATSGLKKGIYIATDSNSSLKLIIK